MKITTKKALKLYKNNGSELARDLGISRAAVSHWGKYVPGKSAFRLFMINPEYFGYHVTKISDTESYREFIIRMEKQSRSHAR